MSREFTDLLVYRTKRKERASTLVGYGSVVMGNIVEVKFTIRVKKTDKSLMVNWPAHKAMNDKWYNDVKVCNKELKDTLEKTIIDTFQQLEVGPDEQST